MMPRALKLLGQNEHNCKKSAKKCISVPDFDGMFEFS